MTSLSLQSVPVRRLASLLEAEEFARADAAFYDALKRSEEHDRRCLEILDGPLFGAPSATDGLSSFGSSPVPGLAASRVDPSRNQEI